MNFIRNHMFLNRRLIQAFKNQKRYLNLLEYQSKSLLKSNGVNVQDFYTVDVNGHLLGNQNLVADEYVIKAQILAGGRGKGHFLNGFQGGVHLTKSKKNVDKLVKEMLGQKLVTKQTSIDGVLVKTVMVAESVEIKDEKYVCLVLDRSENGPVLIASPSGGVDIEAVAKESPNLLKYYPIDVINGLSDEQCKDIIRFLKFSDSVSHLVKDQLNKLWKTFVAIDATQLEINPFAETRDNRVICVDSKIIIDDNAKFRQNDIFHYEDMINDELDKSEVEAIESNLNYIRLNGDIGCLVNGAGLAMATMDLINYHGGKAANFLDVGGGVTENQVYKAFEIISKDSQVKVIFVNVFGGIVNCSTIAKGLVNSVQSLHLELPIIVRLEGTNVDEAKVIIKDSGLNIRIAHDFDDGAKKAVNQIESSPFKFFVDSLSKSQMITAYGSGLTHGLCGEQNSFIISTKGVSIGGLSLAIEGPSKADIHYHDNKDGTISINYLPTAPGDYKISVKFDDNHIKGSPFMVKITGEGRKRNQISIGSCSEVSLPGKISDKDIRSLNALIQAPSGLEEPCFLKRLPTGNIGVSFTPREVGEHVVSVKKMGNHIANSPFKINVSEAEVGDAKKVQVTGDGLKQGKTHMENTFIVNTKNSGFGGLSLSIEGPSKADIKCKDEKDGCLKISYKPTEPGYYVVNLKFADHHVQGSPFTVNVTGEGSNRQREKIQRQRDAVPNAEVGNRCKLTFKMPGISPMDLTSSVASPKGIIEDAEINDGNDSLFAVVFVPKELGIHTVSVKYKDVHIPGSPFQFTVGPLRDQGAHLVKAGGLGLEYGEQGELNHFNVWTREAGKGVLAISVEGPSKAQIKFQDRKDGSCDVSYTVMQPGEYRIGIKFNDQHIPESPFKAYISPAAGDSHKLEILQLPDSFQVNKPAHFIIKTNGAKGELDAKIIGPSGNEDDCFIQKIDSEESSVRFLARENGVHKIHVKFNGVHIPNSPITIKVGDDDADPAAVHAYGNGLKSIKSGAKTDFIVDTCNAGAGILAVTINGPSKVAMDCTEVENGYKVRYTPLAPGDYYLSVKYNNCHIVGSPFKVNCTGETLAEFGGQEMSSVSVETVNKISKDSASNKHLIMPKFKSDASKITSKGMGLKKAYLNKQNQFTVQAGSAGNNILFVGVYGPKGPCDEVTTKHSGRNQYQVSYMVKERGEYILFVKWGDEHIPGSPFRIEV